MRDETSDNPAFIVDKIERLSDLRSTGQMMLAIDLPHGLTPDVISDVRAIVDLYPGTAHLEFRWSEGDRIERLRSRSLRVGVDGALLALRDLLGESSVSLKRAS